MRPLRFAIIGAGNIGRIQADAIARLPGASLTVVCNRGSTSGMDLAEAHRRHIERWFYPCSHALHACLAAMYTDDPRFAAYFEARGAGLTSFVHDAIVANAARYAD